MRELQLRTTNAEVQMIKSKKQLSSPVKHNRIPDGDNNDDISPMMTDEKQLNNRLRTITEELPAAKRALRHYRKNIANYQRLQSATEEQQEQHPIVTVCDRPPKMLFKKTGVDSNTKARAQTVLSEHLECSASIDSFAPALITPTYPTTMPT